MKTVRLFGTSGIRGIYVPGVSGDSVQSFIENNSISPAFAFRFGLALAQLYRSKQSTQPVELWRDVRESGVILAGAVANALQRHNIAVVYRDIAPTTMYAYRHEHWAIVITASHNPAEYNGIKVFHRGRPLQLMYEQQLETIMMQSDDAGFDPDNPMTLTAEQNTIQHTFQMQMDFLQKNTPLDRIKQQINQHGGRFFIPLDLAYGSAACPVDKDGIITRLSPQIAILLKPGIVIVGYGCIRDGKRTNQRIGAAYAYGETADMPGADEMTAFAQGQYGYGSPEERILFLPGSVHKYSSELPDLNALSNDVCYERSIDDNTNRNTALILHPDHHLMPSDTKNMVEQFIRQMTPLPGLMVDCDADRILVTTQSLAKTSIPYLTGDAMIRFFAENAPPETYSEIAFTVESGLSLEVALKSTQEYHIKQGFKPFDIRKVTVGDRSIIDVFMSAGAGIRLGGEPSGHIIFSYGDSKTTRLIDDPFVTWLRLIDLIQDTSFNIDPVLDIMFKAIPEVYCARKPDSRAGAGLTLSEKQSLELWETSQSGILSNYAKVFIPQYILFYCDMLRKVFDWTSTAEIIMTDNWSKLVESRYSIPSDGRDLPIAHIAFDGLVELNALLYLDKRLWAGPEVIRIGFETIHSSGKHVRLGEGIFRNSGTSPKNAGYHKLWIEDPVTGHRIKQQILESALTELAQKRAAFTDTYVIDILRKK